MPKRPEQTEIEINGVGVAPVKIATIEKAARLFVELRDDHDELGKKVTVAKAKLMAAIKEKQDLIGKTPKGEVLYRFDGQQVTFKTGKETVKVGPIEVPDND